MVYFCTDFHHMMRILTTFGRAFSILPPDKNAGTLRNVVYNVVWILGFINALLLLAPLLAAIYVYRKEDLVVVMRAVTQAASLTEINANLVLCRIHKSQIQDLLEEIVVFVNTCDMHQKEIIQKYILRYGNFYEAIAILHFFCGLAFVVGPIVMPIEFPAETWYPFSTKPMLIYCTIYVNQIIAILQSMTIIFVDFTMGLLFWFPTARLEMLDFELRCITSEDQTKECIKKHQEIITLVNKIQEVVKYIAFKTNITMISIAISSAIPLLFPQPTIVLTQLVVAMVLACSKMYVTAWPANDLKEMSMQVRDFSYSAPWIGKSRNMALDLLIMTERSRKPLLISMGVLLPPLTIEYYSSFISTTLSYFMAMRTLIDK